MMHSRDDDENKIVELFNLVSPVKPEVPKNLGHIFVHVLGILQRMIVVIHPRRGDLDMRDIIVVTAVIDRAMRDMRALSAPIVDPAMRDTTVMIAHMTAHSLEQGAEREKARTPGRLRTGSRETAVAPSVEDLATTTLTATERVVVL